MTFSHEKSLAYKIAKNLCNSLNKKAKKTYFEKTTENGIVGGKKGTLTQLFTSQTDTIVPK